MKLRTKLAFIFILIGFLPLLLGGIFTFYFFGGYLRQITYDNLREISGLAALQVESFIEQSLLTAELLKENEILTSGEEYDEEVIQKELDNIAGHYRVFFKDIAVLDKDKNIIGSTGRTSYGELSSNPWFMRAKATKTLMISDIYEPSDGEEPIMAIFVPNLDDEGEIISFIVLQIDMTSLYRELGFRVGNEGKPVLVNSQGHIIFHPEREKIFTKISENYPLEENLGRGGGVFDAVIDGKEVVYGFRLVVTDKFHMGWQLVVMQPKEEVFGFLRMMETNYALLSIVFLLPIILLSFLISRRTMGPLRNLSLVSKKVARGNLKARAEVFSKDEFGEVAENFNKMIEDLEQAKKGMEEERDILEIKVNARTKELNELNEQLEGKVQKRTEEMKKKLDELEKMSKLMVGRELKMIELKKALKKAKEEIEGLKEGNNNSDSGTE